MSRDTLGQRGEKIVRAAFPEMKLHLQPASGARWPRKQDLEGPRHVVQVKTTMRDKFLSDYLSLLGTATIEGKEPRWYEVHITANEREAVIVERRVVKIVDLGVGGG